MCEISSARYFRPWNRDERVVIKSKTGYHDEEKSSVSKQVKTNNKVKCEFNEEDVESITSISELAKKTHRSSVSSYSDSNDDMVNPLTSGSLDLLSNFVFNSTSTTNQDLHQRTTDDHSPSDSSCSSIPESPKSAFTPTYQSSGSFSEYLPTVINSAVVNYPNYSSRLYYGFPGLPITHYPSVEEAVKIIQEQDVAAKQMKKLRPKKFRCEYCNVAFSNNGQLKGHIRIHTGERPFKCDAENCGKSFTRNEELTRHKRIHTGLRPHSCVICGKRFGRKDHLKKHTRTHDNRGPYHLSAFGTFTLNHSPLTSSPYLYPI